MRRPDVFTLDYSHPLAQGLVLASMMRRGRDESLRNLHGAIVNIPDSSWYVDDTIRRHAVKFSGGGDYIDHPYKPSAIDFGSGGTLASWLMFGTESTNEYIGSWNAPRALLGKLGGQPAFGWGDSTQYGTSGDVAVGLWRHFAISNNGSTSQIYINGVEIKSAVQSFSGTQVNNFGVGICIGVGRPMQGPVADTVLYNRPLSPAEIALLADRTDPMLGGLVREVNPVAYFDFGGASAGTDNLTATDLVTGSPVLGTPALGQVHALTATALTMSSPVLGSPSLGQIHRLVAPAMVVGSPVLGTPSLSETAPDVDALTAVGLVVGSPVLDTPAIGQAHSLTAVNLSVASPVLGTPSLEIGTDNLVANSLAVGSPVLGAPALGQIHVLGTDGLTVSSPVLGTPSLEIGKDHLTAQDLITEGPVLGTPALRQIHALVASFSTAAPEIGTPALTQAHALIPVNLAAGSPVLGTPMLFDLEYTLQTRAELKSLGTTNFTSPLYGATHIELRCYGNYEVNEFGE